MWEITALEHEKHLQSEQQQQQLQLTDEMSQASVSHSYEKMAIDHLRAQVAALRASEHNAHAEINQ